MPPPPFASALILGASGSLGGYLARLLQARGVAITAIDIPAASSPDTITALGIADDIARLDPADAEGFAHAGGVAAIFAIAQPGGADPHAEAFAELVTRTIAASHTDTRISLVADIELLHTHRGVARVAQSIAALRIDHGRHAANVLLQHHDSRFGSGDSMPARVTTTAFRIARGETIARLELNETGPRDWGWTPEYVDAIQRLAALDRPRDLVVASGHALTTAEFARHAFEFFGLKADDHIRIEAAAGEVPAMIDHAATAAALKAATGWSASTWGRDLVRALCEGAGDRAPPATGRVR